MPVGTQATVKGLAPEAVRATGADIVLANTYHLMLRPGAERIAALGGLHAFMNWPHADPHRFRRLPGHVAVAIAQGRGARRDLPLPSRRRHGRAHARARDRDPGLLGSDIAMQLDECVKLPADRAEIERAMRLCRCAGPSARKRAFEGAARAGRCSASCRAATTPACAPRARARSSTSAFDGYAIGGLAVGEPQEVMLAMIEEVGAGAAGRSPALSDGRRHARTISSKAVARGIDMFDCVLPTRNGRHGLAFTRFGPINLKNARHADDPRPLDEGKPVRGGARLFARLSPSPGEGQRDARRHRCSRRSILPITRS